MIFIVFDNDLKYINQAAMSADAVLELLY